jgi:hypothetical protein
MDRTAHPRRVGLHERPLEPKIYRTPPTPPGPVVITRTPPPAPPTPTCRRPPRTHRHDHRVLIRVELDRLDHRLLDPDQPSQYAASTHAVPTALVSGPRQPET